MTESFVAGLFCNAVLWAIFAVAWLICGFAEWRTAVEHGERFSYQLEPGHKAAYRYWFTSAALAISVAWCCLVAAGWLAS